MSKFTERFQLLRKESKKTQAAIAKELEMTPQTLSYYANGREPNYDTLIKIADYFKVTTDYLLGYSENRYSQEQVGATPMEIQLLSRITNSLNSFFMEYNKINLESIKSLDIAFSAAIEGCFNRTIQTHRDFLKDLTSIDDDTSLDEIENLRNQYLFSIGNIRVNLKTDKDDIEEITQSEIARSLVDVFIEISANYRNFIYGLVQAIEKSGMEIFKDAKNET